MTIFRCSAVALSVLAAGCGPETASNLPDAQTPLGRIARIDNFAERSGELKRFAEARKGKPQELEAEFRRAGFVASKIRDDNGVECQRYNWESQDLTFQVVMLVNICGQEVFANAGQRAP